MEDETRGRDKELDYAQRRWEMVEYQLISRGIRNKKVIEAFLNVPRHLFVPERFRHEAYYDGPLPIGAGQTISQPYIVALMTELLDLEGGEKVLEVGTGSGYQAAILAEIGCEVYTVEIIDELSERARALLESLGYKNVHYKVGDGHQGWEEHAPFDAIIVTAAPEQIPKRLIAQLKVGGRMVIPVGGLDQDLLLITKHEKGLDIKSITPVRFVPMTGGEEEAKGNKTNS
jgi:protein-L-isoaspartate(D-aspartate) O-methyltransferase